MARRFLTPDTTPPAAAAADGTDADAAPPASSHLLQWHLHGSAVTKVAIAGNVVVVLLFFAAIIWLLFFKGTGTTAHSQEGAAVDSPQVQGASEHDGSSSSTPPCASPRLGRLGKAELLTLPVYVVHGSSGDGVAAETDGAQVEGPVECAVCLGELSDGETGRMLPRCGHRFHAECVHRWFRLHVTCPLCRAAVVADGGSGR